MKNRIKQEINKIEIPKGIGERSKLGILKANKEMQNSRKKYTLTSVGIVAGLLLFIGSFAMLNDNIGTINNVNTPIATNSDSITIPAIKLPNNNSKASMLSLIVYNGKIYTQSKTEINAETAKTILGDKLGKTKDNIDEWSKLDAKSGVFPSTIGITDVFSVKGYDKDFRIMTFKEQNGKTYAELYENLNGLTINSGEDIFGKLKMIGNVSSAEYRTFSDWDNNINNFHPIGNLELINEFAEELNKTQPFLSGETSEPITISNNNEDFRELTVHLNDGTHVKLILLKDGHIYYGFMDAYFKMNDDIFLKLWNQLK